METPLPTDLDSLRRRLEALESAVLGQSRRLESASVGAGGLTVRQKGALVIEDGGSLKLKGSANLELADGVIDGRALKSQLEAQSFYQRATTGVYAQKTKREVVGIDLRAPSWATQAVVSVSGSGWVSHSGSPVYGSLADIGISYKIGSRESSHLQAITGNMGGRFLHGSYATTVAVSSSTRVGMHLVTGDNGLYLSEYSSATISGIVLWLR